MKRLLLLIGIASGTLWAQAPTITAVLNNADLTADDTRLCPGALAQIVGAGFGTSAAIGSAAGNVTVSVGGTAALVQEVEPNQISIQIPFTAPVGATTLTVTVSGQTSSPFNITLTEAAPTVLLQGAGNVPAIFNSKNTLITTSALANPGDLLTLAATGLGQTSPATTNFTAPSPPLPLASPLTLTVGGVQAVVSAAAYQGSGEYLIQFLVPATVQGSVPVVLSIDGQSSPPATLALFGISAITNGASYANTGSAAPEEFVTVYANGLGTKDQLNAFPATTVQGVTVTFNGVAAPIFDLVTESGQINLVVPSSVPASGTVQVQLTTPTGTTANYPLTMSGAVPGMFLLNDPSNPKAQEAVAQFANTTWIVASTATASALQISENCTTSNANPLSSCGQPAAPGDYLVLYLTGLGEVTPNGSANETPLGTGVVAPADGSTLYETTATPTVTLGGVPVTVLFSGIAPGTAGEYQIDFQVPSGVANGDTVPLIVSMPSGSTTATATLAIQSGRGSGQDAARQEGESPFAR